jgi:hypothetical protein
MRETQLLLKFSAFQVSYHFRPTPSCPKSITFSQRHAGSSQAACVTKSRRWVSFAASILCSGVRSTSLPHSQKYFDRHIFVVLEARIRSRKFRGSRRDHFGRDFNLAFCFVGSCRMAFRWPVTRLAT